MEDTYDFIYMSVESQELAREKQMRRCFAYFKKCALFNNNERLHEKKMNSDTPPSTSFWDRESVSERKLYGKMKKWETRHPIIGIVICTILLEILISLIAGIILEEIMLII